MSLGPALVGDRFELASPSLGKVGVYVAGVGPPVLLVHTVNAAASAAEVRPLYDHLRATHTVYAPDLPGFGFSDRSDRVYTPRLMTDALHAVVAAIAQRSGPEPVDALAVSLGCEFLARAAVEAPTAFRTLALVSPTGFAGKKPRRAPPGTTRFIPWLYRLLCGPGWGKSLFRLLARPAVVRYFLRRTWGSRAIDEELWRYDVETARPPGAEHAPLYFLSGGLFSADIHDIYEALALPVWMSHGVRGDFTDYRGAALVADRPGWRFSEFDTGALPYFEAQAAARFLAEYDAFISEALPPSTTPTTTTTT